jgi:hypothetical protein
MDTRGIGDLDGDTQEPPVGGAGHGAVQHFAGELLGHMQTYPPQIGNTNLPALDRQLIVGQRKAVVPALFLNVGYSAVPSRNFSKAWPH